jgi:hypothetical protein
MFKFCAAATMAVVANSQFVPAAQASAFAPTPATPPPSLSSAYVPPAPTPATCIVPWPTSGRWLDCIPETYRTEGQSCTFEHQFGMKCVYEDGPIMCNDKGKFERNDKNANTCTKIPYPVDLQGCARFDLDDSKCKLTEGCSWANSVCSIVCRQVGCGVELHRLNTDCQFNCPLHNATECSSWQAGCACIQDTKNVGCTGWCTQTNAEKFTWLPTKGTSAESYKAAGEAEDGIQISAQMTVGDAMRVKNDDGYDGITLCQDACFQRGVCISEKVSLD